MMRRYTFSLSALLLTLVLGSSALAQDMQPANPLCTGAMVFCSSYGRPILTYNQAIGLRERGYPWNSIYAASIIAARTGARVDDLLRDAYVSGRTWPQIAMDRGLNWSEIRDEVYDFGPECPPGRQIR